MTKAEKRVMIKAIYQDKKPSQIDPEQPRAADLDYMYYFGTLWDTGEGVATFHTEQGELKEIVFFD